MTILMNESPAHSAHSKFPKPVILSPSFGRRTSRDVSVLSAPSGLLHEVSCKGHDAASTYESSRQVLRPKEGLRMRMLIRVLRSLGLFPTNLDLSIREGHGLQPCCLGTIGNWALAPAGLEGTQAKRTSAAKADYLGERPTARLKPMPLPKPLQVSFLLSVCVLLSSLSPLAFAQQDKFQGVVTQGVERVRIAVADFKATNGDPNTGQLLTIFNSVLYSDLQNAGIFDVVSKSFNPLQVPGTPQEVMLDAWGNPPTNAAMLAFGNLGVINGQVSVSGWLYDVKNTVSPQVLGKQYREDATPDNARLIAHRFADEIIFRLGGGIPGIA